MFQSLMTTFDRVAVTFFVVLAATPLLAVASLGVTH